MSSRREERKKKQTHTRTRKENTYLHAILTHVYVYASRYVIIMYVHAVISLRVNNVRLF